MEKKTNNSAILFIGLALFATYFGAGNMIFPPITGLLSGTGWSWSIIGLAISGVLLPVVSMVVIAHAGSVTEITRHVSDSFYNIIIGAIMFIVIFVANPRTAATATEMGIQGIFPGLPYFPCVIVYFTIVYLMARNKSDALDKIGKYLTPAMVIILVTLIVLAFVHPIGTPIETSEQKPFTTAFLTGYNTGDVLVSFLLASVFLGMIEEKGYTGAAKIRVVTIAAAIAFCGLFIVYSGLLYMGACASGIYPDTIGRAELLKELINRVGGRVAMIGFGVAAVLACLTTAIAQATSAADYLVNLSKGRLTYGPTIIGVCVMSAAIAMIGVDKIVLFSGPLYNAIYPVILVLVILGVTRNVIPNDGGYKGAVIGTLIYSVLEALGTSALNITAFQQLTAMSPLAADGFGWILPGVVGFIIGTVIWSVCGGKKEAPAA